VVITDLELNLIKLINRYPKNKTLKLILSKNRDFISISSFDNIETKTSIVVYSVVKNELYDSLEIDNSISSFFLHVKNGNWRVVYNFDNVEIRVWDGSEKQIVYHIDSNYFEEYSGFLL
jgi:hypothetical protein